MGTASQLTAIHLALLADHEPGHGSDSRVCAVLAYDGQGRRHLHPVSPATPAEHVGPLADSSAPRQLALPLDDSPSSAGRTWRTWVLPTIPTALRTLPPERLVAAFAAQLARQAAS